MRQNNINVTIHAGEAYGPASVAQALHICGAHRIGHGCRLREDGDLLHYVVDHRIPLECCPSSNVQTGAVKSLASHPMRLYINLGSRVTVNTDNRLITDTSRSPREMHLMHVEMGFTLEDMKQVILNGFKKWPSCPSTRSGGSWRRSAPSWPSSTPRARRPKPEGSSPATA